MLNFRHTLRRGDCQILNPPIIGVLALQGAFEAHARALTAVGAEARLIRRPSQLEHIDGLIIPGGESTTFLKHLERDGFFDALNTFVRRTPTFGTCAGVILLATDVENPPQASLAALDVTVTRNAYGRQIDSTILTAPTSLGGGPLEMVFIRAPRISRTGPEVAILATRDEAPVLVRQGHLLAATFHPELSSDTPHPPALPGNGPRSQSPPCSHLLPIRPSPSSHAHLLRRRVPHPFGCTERMEYRAEGATASRPYSQRLWSAPCFSSATGNGHSGCKHLAGPDPATHLRLRRPDRRLPSARILRRPLSQLRRHPPPWPP